MRLKGSIFVACIILLPAVVSVVRADDLADELHERVAKMRKNAEMEKDNDRAKQERVVRQRVADIAQGIAPQRSQEGTKPSRLILSHQLDERGLTFPKAEEVVYEPRPTPTPAPVSDARTAVVRPYSYERHPTKCERNSTVSKPRGGNGDPKRVFYDVLYLPEDLIPTDPTEVFGIQTDLRPYGGNSGEGVHVLMEVDDVPCVPYRVRITQTTKYIDTGRNALKNYDKNPAGEGEFHPFIVQKLFGSSN